MSTAEPVQIPLVWVGVEQQPIELASHFVAQVQAPDEIILTFGQTAPPMVFGTQEEQATQLRASIVQVKPLARISVTTHRLREMLTMLQQTLDAHETLFRG